MSMTEGEVTIIVAGLIQITGMVIGFMTLWVKLRYGAEKAAEAATKAKLVEDKIDANTLTTNAVDTKTNTIVEQTNGSMDRVRALLEATAERVAKLEDYNHTSAHRLMDTVHALGLKVERMLAVQEVKTPPPTPAPTENKV